MRSFGLILLASKINSPPVVIKNQGFLAFAGAPINYRSADVDDAIARLEATLERGEALIDYEPQRGYLRSVLKALHTSLGLSLTPCFRIVRMRAHTNNAKGAAMIREGEDAVK